jgi:hypothetical protein
MPGVGFVPTIPASKRAKTVFFLILVCEVIGTAATPGLLCQPRGIVKMIVEKQIECRLAGETEVLGENLLQRHFCPSQNPTWPDPALNPGRRGGKPATNRLSYGAASQASSCLRPFGYRDRLIASLLPYNVGGTTKSQLHTFAKFILYIRNTDCRTWVCTYIIGCSPQFPNLNH